jgi:hypothetical protein
MKLSDSTNADASNTSYVLETPAQFLARGGVVTVVVPAVPARGNRAAKIRINASRNVQVNYNHPVNKG